MKKVAVIYTGSSEFGGFSRYLTLLFSNYDPKKIDLRLISLGEWPTSKKIEKAGGTVVYLNKQRISIKSLLKITGYLKREKINLVVTIGMLSDFYGRKASFLTGVPHLATLHSDWRFDYPGFFQKTSYLFLDRSLRPVTKKYLTVSNSLKEKLVKSGIPEKKIAVVYNGVTEVKRKENKEKRNQVVVGSAGRLHSTKGFDLLVEAAALLPKEAIVKIWGEGEARRNLEKKIKILGLEEKVFLPGHLKEIEEGFSQIDIYVQPSRMEGFGLTVAEAMTAGLPVVVTPVGSLPELVENKKTGLVAENLSKEAIAKELEKLIEDEKLRNKLGENAHKAARDKFSIQRWIKETENIFLETAK